jgi:hypothetical protein
MFGALPTSSMTGVCGTHPEFVSMDVLGNLLCVSKRDVCEMRDIRKPKTPLWTSTHGMVRHVAFGPTGAVLVNSSDRLAELHVDSGKEIGALTHTLPSTSNIVRDKHRMLWGTQDGGLTVSFTAGHVAPIAAAVTVKKAAASKPQQDFFARVDESKVMGEGQVMNADEALQVLKGTKRMKNDLRDDMGNSRDNFKI